MAYRKHRVEVVAPACGHTVLLPAPLWCRECYHAAQRAFRPTRARLAAVEGEVRRLVGTRALQTAADLLGVDRGTLSAFCRERGIATLRPTAAGSGRRRSGGGAGG